MDDDEQTEYSRLMEDATSLSSPNEAGSSSYSRMRKRGELFELLLVSLVMSFSTERGKSGGMVYRYNPIFYVVSTSHLSYDMSDLVQIRNFGTTSATTHDSMEARSSHNTQKVRTQGEKDTKTTLTRDRMMFIPAQVRQQNEQEELHQSRRRA